MTKILATPPVMRHARSTKKQHLHEVHRELPLYISFRTSLLFLSHAEFVDDFMARYPTLHKILIHGFYQMSLKMCTFCYNICNAPDV